MNDLDNILDGTLDDLADLPPSGAWPAGAHKAIFESYEIKVLDDKKVTGAKNQMLVLKFKAVETLEPGTGVTESVVAGQLADMSYFLKHASSETAQTLGQGKFKEIMQSFAETLGAKSNRELLEEAKGREVLMVTKQRKSKKGDQEYVNTDLVKISLI